MQGQPTRKYSPSTEVDFVIVGSGAAGGVLAKQLSTRGHSVVVLEAGPRLAPSGVKHDEFDYWLQGGLGPKAPVTWRQTADQEAKVGQGGIFRASLVGGSSVHFTANYWRLPGIDFLDGGRVGRGAAAPLPPPAPPDESVGCPLRAGCEEAGPPPAPLPDGHSLPAVQREECLPALWLLHRVRVRVRRQELVARVRS